MRVGDLEILPVHDGVALLPPSEAFVGTPDAAWGPHRQFLTSDGELELALGGFLLRTGDRVVLVDCGVGRIEAGPFKGGAFLASLAALGVQPAEVTDVLFTHLHFDHVGWATQQGAIVFPNATYRCDDARLGALRRSRPGRDPQAVAAGRPDGVLVGERTLAPRARPDGGARPHARQHDHGRQLGSRSGDAPR